MADTAVAITAGTGTNIDTRTEATNGNHRQVIVIGDPSTNAGVAPVDETSGLKVDLGADNDITGTVTANAGTNLNTSALALESGGNLAAIKAKTDNIPALGQALAASSVPVVLTAAQLTTLTPPAAITGFATAANQLPDGHNVTVDNASIAVTGTFWQATQPVSGTVAVTNAGITTIAGAVSGTEMQVDVLTMPTVTVTASNLDVQSGGADLATSAQGAAIQTAVEIIDNAISGSEMQVDVVGALPAGTNAIGKLAANSGVDIGDVTLTAGTDAIGKLLPSDVDVTAHTNYARKYYTNAGAATDGIIWSPAAGKRWHVVTMYIQVSAAATVTLEDDKAGGDDPVWKGELAANSGVVLSFTEKYPMASGEDAADLLITTTAGNVYVTAVGYEV